MPIFRQDRIVAEAPQKLSIRCSLTDVFVRDVQISFLFFYAHRLNTVALARGLARVLSDFAPFNARLRQAGLDRFIECGNTGATFTIARNDSSLAATISRLDDRARRDLVDVIDARGAWSTGDPVLAIRVTEFADGQSALGVSWHHTVGDLQSLMGFMRAWSREVAGDTYVKPILVDDRDQYLNEKLPTADRAPTNLRYMRLLELSKLAAYVLTKGRDKRRVTFYFDPDELDRMRAALQSECGQRLSISDAISAHVCGAIAARDTQARDRRVSIAVDFRKRMGLPENVIGNMVSTIDAPYERGKPVSSLAADLRGALDNFADRHMNHRANLRLVESHGGIAKIGRFIPTGIDPFSGSLLVTNCSRYGIYDIDFGEAAPFLFLPASEGPLPWLGTMQEGFHNRGLNVEFELPRGVAARMLDEAGLREVHRYRDPSARSPDDVSNQAWLS
jgi:hypothetical protein